MKKLIYIFILFFMYNSCCKDCTDDSNPECPNYNPCKGKTGNLATFTIYDINTDKCDADFFCEDKISEFPINADTFYNNTLKFEANYPNASSYKWIIGAGEYTQKSFVLGGFPDVGVDVPVSLIVNYNPNSCRGGNRSSDTFSRIIQRGSNNYIKEVFQGYDVENPSEIYTWTFDTLSRTYPSTGNRIFFYVLMKDSRKSCTDTIDFSIGYANSNRQSIVSGRKPRSGGAINAVDCSGYYNQFSFLYDSLNTSLKMKYSFSNPIDPKDFKYKTFIGKRIQ
jgi:hypothetical protein